MIQPIESPQNAKFKTLQTLLEGRGIKKAGQALISGAKLVNEFLAQHPTLALELLLPPKAVAPALPTHIKVFQLASPLFRELDAMGTHSPLLVVGISPLPNWQSEAPRGLELIVALSDPGNLGAMLRSAEAFGVSKVILTQESCTPFLPRAIRASSGACFRLKLESTGPLAELSLQDAYVLDMQGTDLAGFQWPANVHLVLGEEGRGIPENLKLKSLKIGMAGQVESLNAMAAASIALFTYRSQNK